MNGFAIRGSPREKVTAGEFAAVVHANAFWSAALRDHAVQRTGNAPAGQTGIDFQGKTYRCGRIPNRKPGVRAGVA
jgi:hypothetical protein